MESRRAAGMSVAGPDGTIELVAPAGTEQRLVIGMIDLDQGTAETVMPPARRSADERLVILAVRDRSSIVVEAGEVYIVYARKKAHAWTHHAHDGGSLDADGVSNGRIEIALQSLDSLTGNVPPPAAVASGDAMIALEPRTLRSGEAVIP
jgi:hypothetical protein